MRKNNFSRRKFDRNNLTIELSDDCQIRNPILTHHLLKIVIFIQPVRVVY